MKQTTALLIVITSCIAGFGNAYAATWDGTYVGVAAGMGKSTAKFATGPTAGGTYFSSGNAASVNATGSSTASESGFTTGFTLGYNVQKDSFVYGGEFDASYLRNKIVRSNDVTYPASASLYRLNQVASVNGLVTFRARAGYAFGNSLVYGTGGLALTSLKSSYNFSDNAGTNAFSASSQTKPTTGLVLGIGYEQVLQNKLSIKAEYLYVAFNEASNNAPMSGGNASFSHNAKVTTNIIRLGINFKF